MDKIHIEPLQEVWQSLCVRPALKLEEIEAKIIPIISAIKAEGDQAIKKYNHLFDKFLGDTFQVTEIEIEIAVHSVSEKLKNAIQIAAHNIKLFHERQAENFASIETMPGVKVWRKSIPLDSVGLYIPGGSAPLFSSVLMLAIPAQVAGVKEIVLCTPPSSDGTVNPAILYAAYLCGISKIYKVGGAQAIAAMAIGTATVPKVNKVLGPGNSYVTAAKQYLSKEGLAIDMPAGPSEVLVIADEEAPAAWVAADLLSQAEHGPDSQVILCCQSEAYGAQVIAEVQRLTKLLPRKEIIELALKHSKVIIFKDLTDAISFSNLYAPEHLILAVKNPERLSDSITNAGSVFMGYTSPEAAGDYASGTNHTLPTNGYAKAYSGVSLDTFVKKVTFQKISPAGLENIGDTIETMAEAEQLEAHKLAVSIRRNGR